MTIVIMLGFGALTGMASPRMEANLATPWMGLSERVSVGAYMAWVVVFAIALLRGEKEIDPNETNTDNHNQQ